MKREHTWLLPLLMTLALFTAILPLPGFVAFWWPNWVALLMIYWHLETPHLRGLGAPFALGLLLDVLTGSLLGQNALGLVIINFLVGRFRNRIRFFPIWQQSLIVGALLINDRIVNLWIIGLVGHNWPSWDWWLPPLAATLIWPWLYLLLDRLRMSRPA